MLKAWCDHLLPELDVWFRDEDPLDLDVSGCVVMPRADYLQHPTFRDIRYVNAYLHWQMPLEITRIIVSGPASITSFDVTDRHRVLEQQVHLQ